MLQCVCNIKGFFLPEGSGAEKEECQKDDRKAGVAGCEYPDRSDVEKDAEEGNKNGTENICKDDKRGAV